MPLLRQFLLRIPVLSYLVLQALGQNSVQTFGWKFRTDFLSTSLPSCFNFSLVVFPNPLNATAGNYSGTPPYYMMAFPEGGQPLTTLVGTDNDTLSWLPQHPVGTNLILQMMDSLGNTGGTGGSVYQVVQNTHSTNCVVPTPPEDFKISSNITGGGTLETCQPWRLNIDGGRPPYTVVLDARNSPVLRNITIPATDDALVFINRADPGTVLFAAVVDSTERWGTGTQYVSTAGTTNISCIGLGMVTANQTALNQQDALQAAQAAKNLKRRASIIVGVVDLLVSVLLIVGGFGAWLYMRKRNAQYGQADPDSTPRQFVQSCSGGQVLSISRDESQTNFVSTLEKPGEWTQVGWAVGNCVASSHYEKRVSCVEAGKGSRDALDIDYNVGHSRTTTCEGGLDAPDVECTPDYRCVF